MIRMRRLSDRFAKIRVQDSPPDDDGSAGEYQADTAEDGTQ